MALSAALQTHSIRCPLGLHGADQSLLTTDVMCVLCSFYIWAGGAFIAFSILKNTIIYLDWVFNILGDMDRFIPDSEIMDSGSRIPKVIPVENDFTLDKILFL